MNYIEIVNTYFEAMEERDTEKVIALFDENCEVFLAKTGVIKGIEEFTKFSEVLVEMIKRLDYKNDEFSYKEIDNTLIIEGQESGRLKNGNSFEHNKFCSVFDFHPETHQITRMYVYTDPNFGR